MAGFQVSGFDALDRKLAQLERGFDRKKVVGVLRRGANVIAREERALVPVRSGDLRRSITVTTSPGFTLPDARNEITIFVGPKRGAGSIAHLVEWGTIRTAAHPFIQPAIDKRGEEAIGIVLTGLQGLLQDAVK
jgi:HK97 gp10 family phage protein